MESAVCSRKRQDLRPAGAAAASSLEDGFCSRQLPKPQIGDGRIPAEEIPVQSSQPVSFVAWYGAVVSTLGFSLALYVALRDRSRLRISVQANVRFMGQAIFDPEERYLVVTVANRGRRTVTVEAVSFSTKSGDILLGDSVREGPKEVAEGKAVTYIAEQARIPLASLKRVAARDTTGRVWKRRVPRNIRRAAASSPPAEPG